MKVSKKPKVNLGLLGRLVGIRQVFRRLPEVPAMRRVDRHILARYPSTSVGNQPHKESIFSMQTSPESLKDQADGIFIPDIAEQVKEEIERKARIEEAQSTSPMSRFFSYKTLWLADIEWTRTPIGEFKGEYTLKPKFGKPGVYNYVPDAKNPFQFVLGKITVEPKEMDTDMGSIPKIFQFAPHLQPGTYLPAYLIHDWLFWEHHRIGDANGITFTESAALLNSGIKTLMVKGGPYRIPGKAPGDGPVEKDEDTMLLIYLAVQTAFARSLWDGNNHGS